MIIKILGVGLITAVLAVLLRKYSEPQAIAVSVAGGLVITAFVIGDLTAVLKTIKDLAVRNAISEQYILMLVKVIGIAYITEFMAETACDAGEKAIGAKIRFGGKVTILALCTPVIINLLSMITGLLK